ncbi:adenylate kinase 7-like [Amphibalanus amphitrite]|uniref:adenylate kinase 7-like n=1 Tax=Amphibalanus amphitrite TaxID=1232801 RepID=UPI001C90545B|nr:adenylate kinase 7-like [Amphibalanus amphitrite]
MSDNEEGTPQPELEKHIFLSTLDSYLGRNLAELFTGQVQAVVPEEEEEVENEENDDAEQEKKSLTTIHGVQRHEKTVSDPSGTLVLTAAQAADRDTLLACLELCEVIIYDITSGGQELVEEATWAVETLHDRLELWPKRKVFILISTVMTWAKTKPLDPDDPDSPFTEDDYRRRRPHPHFQEHLNCEKTTFALGKTNKKKFKTYVIAAGATFGKGEDIFHSWMKQAWHNEKELTIFGRGNNVVPTIHILDLAQVVQCVFDTRPTTRYILAVDGLSNTQREIVKAISSELSTGQVKRADKEDVFLTDLNLLHADLVTTDLKMESMFLADNIEERRSESGFVEGIADVVKEFRTERKLQPMRICILGPPVSGKTFLAEKLCKIYKLHHLHLSEIIEAAIKNLEEIAHPPVKDPPPVTLPDEPEGDGESPTLGEEEEEEDEENADIDAEIEEEEEEEEDEEKMTPEEAAELLLEIEEQRAANHDNRLDDATVLQFVEERIRSKPCRNQGFVLDGFPKLVEQAEALFGVDEEADDAPAEGEPAYNRATMPELVIALDAPDELLCERAINLPEEKVQGTHWTEEAVLRRLTEYRANNREDVTVLNFFDELEVHPLLVDVTKDESEGMEDTCRLLQKRLGAPRNYGLTKEEAEEKRQRQEAERLEQERQAREEAERCAREEMDSRRREQMVWMERLTEVKRQELEALEARSLPLRSYLMKHVIPTLTQGLLECAKVKPEDPVDYLAEYLFTNNPQTNLVEWEELQKSKLEAKEAARKQMMDNWLAEDTVEHVGREAPVAEGGTEPEASEQTSANTSHETVDASPK